MKSMNNMNNNQPEIEPATLFSASPLLVTPDGQVYQRISLPANVRNALLAATKALSSAAELMVTIPSPAVLMVADSHQSLAPSPYGIQQQQQLQPMMMGQGMGVERKIIYEESPQVLPFVDPVAQKKKRECTLL